MCFFARDFDPEAGFPLVLSLSLGHRVLCLYMIRHCFVKSQGGCRRDLPKVTVSCLVDLVELFDQVRSELCV